jgi:RNA polymerase sigma-70 factor (ECF subfamily)
MPADVLAVTLAVGPRARSKTKSERVSGCSVSENQVSEQQDPARGRMAGQERRIHDAQDVYQDAFLKAYKNIGSFRFECSFYTWIYRIVTNLCLDHLRKKNVRKEDAPVVKDASGGEFDLLNQVPDGRAGANPERDLMRRQLGARISGALEKLTPRERMVFELKHYHGLKLRTVGEILHTTEETAKNTLFRATQKLRGQLADMR